MGENSGFGVVIRLFASRTVRDKVGGWVVSFRGSLLRVGRCFDSSRGRWRCLMGSDWIRFVFCKDYFVLWILYWRDILWVWRLLM